MRNLIAAVFLGCLGASAQAETHYFAVYLHDIRIGYEQITTTRDTYEGKPAVRTDTHYEAMIVYVGRHAKSTIDLTDFSSLDNRPLREELTSHVDGDPAWHIDCKFGESNVEANMEATDGKFHVSVPAPSSPFYYDLGDLIAQKCPKPGDSAEYTYFRKGIGVLHPGFVTVRLHTIGYSQMKVDGKPVRAIVCEEKISGSAAQNFYVTDTGDEIRSESPAAALTVVRTSKEFALSPLPKNVGDTDIAYDNVIAVDREADKRIDHVDELAEMRVVFQNFDLSSAPSDESQTVIKGEAVKGYSYTPDNPWSVDVHPPQIKDSVPEAIDEALKGQEKWTRPDMFMPSDDPKMKDLAAKIVAKQKTVIGAVIAIKNYVGHLMKPKGEIGAPRDALQILHDRTGTCSDYTILTVTLLRAAGIAARAVSGLVTWDKQATCFFLHGWSEAWDGQRWVGVDATDRHDQLSACHIKLWEGDMESRLEYQMGDLSKVRALIYFNKAVKR